MRAPASTANSSSAPVFMDFIRATNSRVCGVLAGLGLEIERLSADHAAEPGRAGEHQGQVGANRRVGMGRRVGDD